MNVSIKAPSGFFGSEILVNGQELPVSAFTIRADVAHGLRVELHTPHVELDMEQVDADLFTTIGGTRYKLVPVPPETES